MSANIVELISHQIGGNTNRLSSLLGESPERTQHLAGAAIPTLLAGLTHVASTPEGAHRVQNAINEQEPDQETNFASRLTESSSMNPEASSNMLTNLFGAGLSSNLVAILGRFTGVRSSSVSGLLGSIAPLALGLIGKESKSMGGGASGITSYLNSQKSNIMGAMPSGLSTILGSIPGFGAATQPTTPATPTTRVEPELTHAGASPSLSGASAGSASGSRAETGHGRERTSPTRWLIPLILLAIVLWALYAWNRSRRTPATTEPGTMTEPATRTTLPAAGTTVPNASALSSGLQDTLTSATSTLGGITDANSAQQAVPQLNQISDKLNSMKSQMDLLPASAKPTVMNAAQPYTTKIQDLSAKVRAMPGVGEKIGPTLDKLDASVSSLKQSQ
ncbi:DUF937 domain-containing protein [Pedosphaera parvula]|uniref:DUF937 domain-containing protein n=1 Tax=Pedosphaera parvula (strain Ellin514) TaxID=320771 RepID=B9XIY3_PEDPL|nr:DUF937 domain-containing protein [Pedosphaera parvula]EEF60210.1 hypothetical protein Cflav_PD3269 [Pedosphaera parvula Ellin514]